MRYIAKTMSGFEALLADEIQSLGGKNIEQLNRAVSFEGELEVLYKVNLWARTAIRVIRPFLSFKAHNETVFYKRLRRYDWTSILSLDKTFKINANVHSQLFTHSKYVALKTKDAIVDEFRMKYDGRRPSIELDNPDYLIDVHCTHNEFVISMDSSGASLHKRGYRQSDRRAPLNETLAAGMILLSGWEPSMPFLDPMCGSGTLLMEAYLIAKNIAPRMYRDHFAFMDWDNYDDPLWRSIKLQAFSSVAETTPKIYGFEKNATEYSETRQLIRSRKLTEDIHLLHQDFFTSSPPTEAGMIIVNPPYGMRIEQDEIFEFYRNIGDTFKQKYQGWSAWVLSGNEPAIKSIGLRTSAKKTLYNGSIKCKFHRYDLYKGSKKNPTS